MTVEQAIKSGFKYYCYLDGDDQEPIGHLADIVNGYSELDFDREPVLVAREGEQAVCFDPEHLREIVTEKADDMYYQHCGDEDSSKVENALRAVNFSTIAYSINEALKAVLTYEVTEIKITP